MSRKCQDYIKEIQFLISVFNWRKKFMMIAVVSVLVLGWILASTIGTCAYFANEPRSGKFTSNK